MKILFAGASGYGNMGDDAYKQIFSEHLSSKHEILFTSPYPNMELIDWCDYLVIGGGGLIYNNPTQHFNYMKMYMDRAISQKKHISFISCGVQLVNNFIQDSNFQLSVWIPYFKYADVISVRSEKCRELIIKLGIDSNKVKYYPDLCYLIKPVDYKLTLPNHDVFVLTQLNGVSPEITKLMQSSIKKYILVMSKDDMIISEKVANEHKTNLLKNLTPSECARVLKDAKSIITCRYHGHIFGNAVGCKDIKKFDGRYKSLFEKTPTNINDSLNHIIELKKFIEV